MEFKGTKGKWYRNTKSRIVSSVYSENEEKLIHISGKNNEEAQANALLISKAPEMLEMLKKLTDKDLFDYEKGEPSESYFQYMNEAEQLIKKATTLEV